MLAVRKTMPPEKATIFLDKVFLLLKLFVLTEGCCGWVKHVQGLPVPDNLGQWVDEYRNVSAHHVHDEEEEPED